MNGLVSFLIGRLKGPRGAVPQLSSVRLLFLALERARLVQGFGVGVVPEGPHDLNGVRGLLFAFHQRRRLSVLAHPWT